MTLDELFSLPDDELRAAIAARAEGLVPAPRAPFHIGVIVEDAGAMTAVVLGPRIRRGYVWDAGTIVERYPDGRVVGALARTGRPAVDARALVAAILAEVAPGPWLRTRDVHVRLHDGLIVGRGAAIDLRIRSPTLARHHCRFELAGGRWFVDDLASTNGTWLRGARIRRAELADGDVISAASEDITFLDTLAPPMRTLDAGDDAVWGALFLDRVELGAIEQDPARYQQEPSRPAAVRAGSVTWTGFRGVTITDSRWLFADRDDAEVFADVLLGRERDELPAPLVGDLCACFRATGGVVAILRVDRLVARLAATGMHPDPDLDTLAARMVARAVGR